MMITIEIVTGGKEGEVPAEVVVRVAAVAPAPAAVAPVAVSAVAPVEAAVAAEIGAAGAGIGQEVEIENVAVTVVLKARIRRQGKIAKGTMTSRTLQLKKSNESHPM